MKLNKNVLDCAPAPIEEAWSWITNPSDPELIDVCQAVPSYQPHDDMLAFLADTLSKGQAATYTDIKGILPLRQQLSLDIEERYGNAIHPDNILITAGCNQGFCSVIDSLCQTGDNVIVPLPCYFNHEMWLSIRGVEAQWLDFNDVKGQPDPEQAATLINSNTRAIVLVSPNNPTGAIYSDETLQHFYEVAKSAGIPLVIDETYRDFMSHDNAPHSLFNNPDWRDTFIHLYSFSKAFSLTGFRVGAIVAGGALLDQISKIQDCVAICAPHIGQVAAEFGLRHLKSWRDDNGRIMMHRAECIKQAFNHPQLDFELVSAGAYFAYIKHPYELPARTVAKSLVEQSKIVSLPGTYFGEGQESYMRFAFANVEETVFSDLVDRLIAHQNSN